MKEDIQELLKLSFGERCKYVVEQRCREWKLGQQTKPYFHSCVDKREEKIVEICFPAQDWQLNPRAELHGGMLALFFDTALGIAAHCSSIQWQCTTTDMSVSFIRTIREHDTVCIRSRISKAGRHMIFVTGEAYILETGKLAGTAQASFMVLPGVDLQGTC